MHRLAAPAGRCGTCCSSAHAAVAALHTLEAPLLACRVQALPLLQLAHTAWSWAPSLEQLLPPLLQLLRRLWCSPQTRPLPAHRKHPGRPPSAGSRCVSRLPLFTVDNEMRPGLGHLPP